MTEVRELSFSYGGEPVLRQVSFTLEDHGFTALLGHNGSGKTTLFKCLLGILTGYHGSVLSDNREIRSVLPGELAARIAYIPQSHYPVFNYSVRDMVLMGTTRQFSPLSRPGAAQKAAADEAMERLSITDLADRGYQKLSGGERQLVLIARALAQKAPLLLMDEPTSALDFGNQQRVLRVMRDLSREGYTVLMSTHQPQQVLDWCDRVLALSGGTIIADGEPARMMTEELLYRLYGVPTVLTDTPRGRVILPALPEKEAVNHAPVL